MKHTFKASNDLKHLPFFGKLMNVIDLNSNYSEEATKFYGQLLEIFGKPAESSKCLENAYIYVINAKDEYGNEHILSVYEGPSGPAIGGSHTAYDAALELIIYIKNVKPADYEYEGYYFDTSSKIRRGVLNGRPFYSEIKMTADEHEKAYKEVYSV